MRIALSTDHGGFELKQEIVTFLRNGDYQVIDFGPAVYDPEDDYPDYVIPMANAVAKGIADRGIAVCSSGVGACIAADKVPGVRAALIHEGFSAHQGVEDDDMNVICLGGRVLGRSLAFDLITAFLSARYLGADRHRRRVAKVLELEKIHLEAKS
jgi:ribose 5-phosphate isomerase B